MKAQPLTIPATRAWLGICNCPPNKCKASDARKCADWTRRAQQIVVARTKE